MTESTGTDRRRGNEIVFHLYTARKKAVLYPPTHAYVAESVQALADAIAAPLRDRPRATLSIVNNELYLEGRLLVEDSLAYADLIADLTERDLISISFEWGVTFDELSRFVALTLAKPEEIRHRQGWETILTEENIQHVTVGRMVPLAGDGDSLPGRRVSREIYFSAVQAVISAFKDAEEHHQINVESVEGIVQNLVTTLVQDQNLFVGVSTLHSLDNYNSNHSINVTILTLLMGCKLRFSSPLLYRIGIATLLHDIGKVNVPDEILNKPAGLTEHERAIMQRHPLDGARMVSEHPRVDPLAVVVTAQHHAQYDLKGYPQFHLLDRLHLVTRMMAVADIYDAITSERCYRKAHRPDRAMQILIDSSGSYLDPQFVRVFVGMTGLFPVGTLVQLDSGEIGVVSCANPDHLYRPQVKVIAVTDTAAKEVRLVDLAVKNPDGRYARSIVNSLDPAEHGIEVADFL